MIKKLWPKLTSNNQKVLKKLMKNQFNISLGSFDIDFEEDMIQNEPVQSKLNLKYVKPSIIESLFQEMDMLSWWLYLNDVWSKYPPVPLDENIHWTISQFTPRISGIQKNSGEFSLDVDLMGKTNHYFSNEPKSTSQISRTRDYMNENGMMSQQYLDIRKNPEVISNAKRNLNLTAGYLNQETKRQTEEVFNYPRGEPQSFYKSRTRYIQQELSHQQ